MKPKLYVILWGLETDAGTFVYTQMKVFHCISEARKYGKRLERELNDGKDIDEQAMEGYYFRYRFAVPVSQIDGYRISIAGPTR